MAFVNLDFLKKLVSPGNGGKPAPFVDITKTGGNTITEQNASVFEAEQQGAECQNKSSTTVILSSDYRMADKKSWTDNYNLPQGESVSIEKIMENTYGNGAINMMNQGEKNSAMWSIIDNNRWMIDNINATYEMAQVSDFVQTELQNALGEDAEVTPDMVAAVVNHIYTPAEAIEGETQEQADTRAQAELLESLGLPESFDATSLDTLVASAKEVKESALVFDANVRADQIPPELIAMTDFEAGEDKTIFVPDASVLAHNGTKVREELSETVDFDAINSKLENITIPEGIEPQQYVQNLIAEQYGLGEIQEDGTFRYYDPATGELLTGEGCDTTADLTTSYAGVAILSAIAKEEGNNELFAGMDEDPEAILNAIVAKASSPEGLSALYCPDTEVNVLSDKNADLGNVRSLLIAEDNESEITYIHAGEDSIVPKEDGTLTGADILAAYEYNGKTLAELALSNDPDMQELALSAFEQIASNNPNMMPDETTVLTNYKDMAKANGVADENLPQNFADLTTEQKMQVYMNMDYTSVANENGGEIILENIQYILGETPTPKAPTFTGNPSVPPEDPTEVTDPPTDPPVPPTNPPEVTDPPVPPSETPEVTVEVTVEVTEEVTVEVTQEVTVEVTQEVTVEVTNDVTTEVTNDVTTEVTEEVTVEVTEEVTVEVTEEVTVEVTEEVTVEVTDEVTVEVTKEVTVEVTEEVTVEVTPCPEEPEVDEEVSNLPIEDEDLPSAPDEPEVTQPEVTEPSCPPSGTGNGGSTGDNNIGDEEADFDSGDSGSGDNSGSGDSGSNSGDSGSGDNSGSGDSGSNSGDSGSGDNSGNGDSGSSSGDSSSGDNSGGSDSGNSSGDSGSGDNSGSGGSNDSPAPCPPSGTGNGGSTGDNNIGDEEADFD